ncbi:MAG TPA: hypothetical protein DCZ92_06490 [Elusimicrobia bacterium]|nr:MAG: hypothetical protein A2016_06505 [Elusimicrobia bacterium GWF2_62_30]HBA60455.1 hypothetical protein [Elusimicrobiota bacterium]
MPAKCFLIFSFLFPCAAAAGENLLYFEGQAVGGYSSEAGKAVFHSMSASAPMQKTSAGFDFLSKFSSEAGDTGTLALQGRLAYEPDASDRLEAQLYNAYYRAKTPYGYLWLGHNRPASGLESYFDTHGALLQVLPMYGYGNDRDWGLGVSKDLAWGGAAFSATTGSGMPLRCAGSYLLSARVAKGSLSGDNSENGFYASAGKIPEIHGYDVMEGSERSSAALGTDYALLWDRWELRADLRAGKMRGMKYSAGLARLGLNLLAENRLKLEAQAVYSGLEKAEGWALASGVSFTLAPELTWRALFEYDEPMKDRRVTTQLYYYLPL